MLSPDERLLLRTLTDIEGKIRSHGDYDLRTSTALLRKLLLDGRASLVDRVNRKYRSRLRFEVIDVMETPLNRHMRNMSPGAA
jgi:hypothetical protein